MDAAGLLPAERAFRGWMLFSVLMYAFAVPLFFVAGKWIVPVINAVSSRICALPLYPLPAGGTEGAFWQVLGVSMMMMLIWVCWKIQQDVRRHACLAPIILFSKACSTLLYLGLFVSDHCLAYLIGALTDGPIFLLTFALWYAARPGLNFLDPREEEILVAVGEAFMPPGGALKAGFRDVRDGVMHDIRRSLASLTPMTLFNTRLLIRVVNIAPLPAGLRFGTLLGAFPPARSALVARLESHRFWGFRAMIMGVKTLAMVAFFNQPGIAGEVGYDPQARIRS